MSCVIKKTNIATVHRVRTFEGDFAQRLEYFNEHSIWTSYIASAKDLTRLSDLCKWQLTVGNVYKKGKSIIKLNMYYESQ